MIEHLSRDLRHEFPQMKGFSPRNLQYMRTFAEAYPDEAQFTQQGVAQIPWGHHCILLDKVADTAQMNFYLTAIDKQLKRPEDNPTIGIILCRTSGDKVVAEYALNNIQSPVGVASYQFTTTLPEALKDKLPDIKDLEERLQEMEVSLEGEEP